jgi:Domain of unknown function (DUF4440)
MAAATDQKGALPMRRFRVVILFVALITLSAPLSLFAQGTSAAAAEIRAMMEKSVVDWNKGDIASFATCYKNAPDILFMNAKIYRGYAAMVERYKESYPTREKMGTLNFSQLDVQPLDAHFATVTGHFHLQRTVAGGGDAQGYFLLVVEKTPDGWKIVRDDTTALPAK